MAEQQNEAEASFPQPDWDSVADIVNSYYRASCAADTAKIEASRESTWYNPFSWSLPEIRNVEVDWKACDVRANAATARDIDLYQGNFPKHAPDIITEVQRREFEISRKRDQLKAKMTEVQAFNAHSLQEADESYGTNIKISQFIRDGSAGTLLLGSTFVTGGASAALLGSASVLTGVGKYQDTGSISAGVIAGGGTAIIGCFGVAGKAAKMTSSGKAYVILGKGIVETSSGLAAGSNLEDTLLGGASTIVAEGVATKLFGSQVIKDAFKKMPMPVKITTPGGMRAAGFKTKSLGREFSSGMSKWTAKTATKTATKSAIAASKAESSTQPTTYGPLAGAALLPTLHRTSIAFKVGQGR